MVMEKKYAKKRVPSPSSLEILPASDTEPRPRRSSGVRLAYTDPPASDSELRPRRSSGVRLTYTDPTGER